MTKKYFYSILLTTVLIIFSIAYFDNLEYIRYSTDQSTAFIKSSRIAKNNPILTKFQPQAQPEIKYNFLKQYPSVLECSPASKFIQPFEDDPLKNETYDYSKPAKNETHEQRVVRGVVVYFPIEKFQDFILEFKWMYRSWIEMQKNEPKKWRTDLIVFIDMQNVNSEHEDFVLSKLNCSLLNIRKSPLDKPMCTLINYKALKQRNIKDTVIGFSKPEEYYDHVLNKVDILSDDPDNLKPFYTLLGKISKYDYLDSILMVFDGYHYFKEAGYNFLIRSDMDVFLTPLFGSWLPRHCNDFYVGRGGFSTPFNEKRLRRIAENIGFQFASVSNLGSTWYSTPDQFRLVSYLTLFGMSYLSQEEFSPTERDGKLGVQLWPYWHYGVLLLYGQSLAMNHLIETSQLNVVKLDKYLDYPSYFDDNVYKILHIHVFHGDTMFSKFDFKEGKYDNILYDATSNVAKFYALRIAIEAKKTHPASLVQMLAFETSHKT